MGMPGPVEIHHIMGRTAKHLHIKIGHIAILPVSNEAHRVVERMPRRVQIDMFKAVCVRHVCTFQDLPFTANELLAVLDWHR